ncbi:MAG: aminotransferase class III-fold pyridoxal phosphate-dependent enzyme, partial [Clostridia bacterium]|nr:aminotransferase class III-fold pyridoxal phosphate-dependent enzyme [Clostridia bacterium]
MDTRFAISQYPDTDRINQELNQLIKSPIYSIKPEVLAQYESEYYGKKCQKSKVMIDEAKTVIPGGVQHNLAFNYPFPLVFTKAEGAKLYDIDGNEYYDLLQAGGPTILGSNDPVVREAVIDLLNTCGPSTGLFHEYEYKLGKKIADSVPSVDMFRMLGSGTEACMCAVRVARLATGKKNILKMGGAYHGWSDQLAWGMRVPGTKNLQSNGVPMFVFKHTQEFFPGDLEDLEKKLWLNKFNGGTAAVYIEPIGPESATRPVSREFVKGVETLCRKYGALLVCDEVVSGFRIGMAGAQGYYGIDPDITIFGKVIAGGYPGAGGIAGHRDVMKHLGAGLDSSGKKVKKAMCGGTMAATPISSLAGYTAICEIEKRNACQVAGQRADQLVAGLQKSIDKYNLPF